ncbi:pyridoxal phosphate-dependent transferase [Dichotomocladium elegans]|nr:pyridoxal phosphate-dependent transferase [Dichotomocladium elegans]
MINLLEGKPAVELLPRNRIACSFQVAITAENAVTSMLQYGHERGNELYLDRLARFLTRNYGTFVSVEHLCATPGASLSLQHLLTILTRPTSSTRFAFFQDPTYHLVYKIFSDVGFRRDQFVSIPDDKDGLDTDHLASFLKKHMEKYGAAHGSNNNEYSAVLYCVPTHANPSSTIMSAERREKLVRLAREYNVLIICDDVYEFLTYDADVILPKRVVAYDIDTMDSNQQKPVVVSNGSFSKILAPGMRAGWIEAHPDLIKRIGIW